MSQSRRTPLYVSLLVAAAVVAGSPSRALAKSKHSAKKNRAEPAAEAVPAPDPMAPAAVPAPPAPGTDASGQQQFGQAGAGTGTLTIKGDKMQVVFDGRPFGLAPVTIASIPRGDYVVEGTLPDGRQISRPVTIDENAEATIDLGMFLASEATVAQAAQAADNTHPRLRRASKILLGVSAGALAVGLVFGALELKTHGEYESAPADQATLDSLARTGKREALVANVSFAACGMSLLAAGLTVLPIFLGSEHPTSAPPAVAVTATASAGSAMAGISMRF
jgi:hypothetical protein